MATKKPRRTSTLGTIWRKESGVYVARYTHLGVRHSAGRTFHTHALADQWLATEQLLIARDEWTPPATRRAQAEAIETKNALTLGEYARDYIPRRTTKKGTPLRAKSVEEYSSYLTGRLAGLAAMPLVSITSDDVDEWWITNGDKPGARANAYMFLKQVMGEATRRRLVEENPCQVVNATARTKRRTKNELNELITGLTANDIQALADATQPAQWQALVILLAYSGLRPSEAIALTRADVLRDVSVDGVPRWRLRVNKARSRAEGAQAISATKTEDSTRFAPIPPHVAEILETHINLYAAPGANGALFPSTNPAKEWATLSQFRHSGAKQSTPRGFNGARLAISRPTLVPYDLRSWARHMWRNAGIDMDDAERLHGHALHGSTDAYATIDLARIWPAMERISELAGWVNPARDSTKNTRLLARMTPPQLRVALSGMRPDQLRDALAALDDELLDQVIPLLPAETLAKALEVPSMNAQ